MKVSKLMNPAGVRLYANIKEAADVLGILVELQEETGAITNGTAYYNAVCQRENFGGTTAIGDGIALPHALGLLAKKTVVYTVIAPDGIAWGDETAHIIFLLAISKSEYEEAMAIYDIFVTFLRERAMARLAATRSFDEFKTVAMECVSRF